MEVSNIAITIAPTIFRKAEKEECTYCTVIAIFRQCH